MESSLGGEVYASSEMLDHMSILREFYGHFTGLYPGLAGLEDCESLFTHLKKCKINSTGSETGWVKGKGVGAPREARAKFV